MQSQLNRVSALNKTGLDGWLEAAQVMADGTEKFARIQFAALKSVLRESAERGRNLSEVKDLTDLPARANSNAVATAEKALGYTRSLYDTAHATGVQLFALAQDKSAELRKGWFEALDEVTDAAPGGKTGGTKAALDSTRTTVEAVVDGFTRTAKQSIDLADSVVKTTTDSAAKAIQAIAARG